MNQLDASFGENLGIVAFFFFYQLLTNVLDTEYARIPPMTVLPFISAGLMSLTVLKCNASGHVLLF